MLRNSCCLLTPALPNGGLLERFNGFETLAGHTTVEPLSLPSLGLSFDGATPSNDFVTKCTRWNTTASPTSRATQRTFVDLNAFLGIQMLHGTYLNGGVMGSGPTAEQIANAILLPGSAASDTSGAVSRIMW